MMTRFGALPRKGHFKAVLRIFSYLEKHLKSRLVYNTNIVDVADKDFAVATWSEQYPDAGKTPPYDMPEPLGKMVKITAFCDASHADCLVTRRSTTGILIFVSSTPKNGKILLKAQPTGRSLSLWASQQRCYWRLERIFECLACPSMAQRIFFATT